ncbi:MULTISPECIES: MFS transporter [Pseudomonas]|uniref:MFS transporter n=1 Tax=Pseudomonas TaxID=286 RepID=UPI001BCB46A9|nr:MULTISPECIES: MFS transporter [Pseudomonas]MBS7597301.1 MFS transporter [Pseudomonas sp. RC2C2]UVL23130.1 MFS transporter [Pseudomonas donghuensis]
MVFESIPPGARGFRLVYLAVALLGFLAASSAPTPLYHLYQQAWQFSAATLTLIFAVYALSLLAALLTVGSLSDYLGRRPLILAALLLEISAMGLFIVADSVAWLLAARVLQGFATGMATSVLGAALLDTDRHQGPLVNSLAPLLGMACGALGTSLLVEYAAWPLRLAYWLLLGLFAVLTLLLLRLPESVSRQRGAWASLQPALSVPVQARRALWRMLPVDIAVWALGGFFLSLAPSLVRETTGSTSNLTGGALVAALTLSGAAAIFSLRQQPALRVLRLGTVLLASGVALILLALHSAALGLFFIATLVAGSGFGAGFLGALRSTLPLAEAHERAGLMSTFYVLSYLAFCLPALLAGFMVRHFGLIATSQVYALGLLALCLLAAFGLFGQRSAATCSA